MKSGRKNMYTAGLYTSEALDLQVRSELPHGLGGEPGDLGAGAVEELGEEGHLGGVLEHLDVVESVNNISAGSQDAVVLHEDNLVGFCQVGDITGQGGSAHLEVLRDCGAAQHNPALADEGGVHGGLGAGEEG